MEISSATLIIYTVMFMYAKAEIYDITTIYRLNDMDASEAFTQLDGQQCLNLKTIELHARTNALGVSLHVPNEDEDSGDSSQDSSLMMNPRCGACGWKLDHWQVKSEEYVTSEPTLATNEQETGSCKYDVVQVGKMHDGRATGIQGQLSSPRGETSDTWTIRSMKNQRIKMVFSDLGEAVSGEAQRYAAEPGDYEVKVGQSERQASLGRYEEANLTAAYLLSRDNYLRVQVRKNIQRSFAAVYFFESQDQLTLYERTGTLTSQDTVASADKLCLALLLRSTRAHGTVLDVMAQFNDGRDVHIGRWQDVQEHKWMYVRFTADISTDYAEKEMRVIIIANQEEGATLYIRRIEECDPEDAQSTTVAKKSVSLPVVFNRKSEEIKSFARELNGRCINGGVLTKDSGKCVCPPGFAGQYCAEGCGRNKYGDDCGGKCSSFTRGCRGLVMCKQEVGCDCAPGFHGRLCADRCPEGRYGFGCRQDCGHCEGGPTCDTFTGICPAGCVAGFFGELCIFKYKHLSTAPVVYTHGPHDFEVVFKKDLTQGRGLPRFYKIQYKKLGDSAWTSRQTHKLNEAMDTVVTNITGLATWTYYDVRVVLIDIDLNSYEGEDVPYTTVRTSCVVPEEVEYYIHSSDIKENSFQITWLYEVREDWCPLKYFEVYLKDSWRWVVYSRTEEHSANFTDLLPGKRHRAKLRAVTVQGPAKFSKSIMVVTSDQVPEMVLNLHQSIARARGVEIKWKQPRFTAGSIRKYTIVYKCRQLVACPEQDCSSSAGKLETDTTHATIRDLIPHAQYYVSVSAVSGSQGPAAILFPATDFTAPEIAPELAEPSATGRTAHGFTVHWRMPSNCTGLNGFLSRYFCELVQEDTRAVLFRGHTENTHASFDGLQSATQYVVRVHYVTTGGWSRKHPLLIRVSTMSTQEQDNISPPWEMLSTKPTETTTTTTTTTTTDSTVEHDREYSATPTSTSRTTSWEIDQYDINSASRHEGSYHSKEHGESSNEGGERLDGSKERGWDSTAEEHGSHGFSGENSGRSHGGSVEKERASSEETGRRTFSEEESWRQNSGSREKDRHRSEDEIRHSGSAEGGTSHDERYNRRRSSESRESGSTEDARSRKKDRKKGRHQDSTNRDKISHSNEDEPTQFSLGIGSTEAEKSDYSEIPIYEENGQSEYTVTETSSTTTTSGYWWNR